MYFIKKSCDADKYRRMVSVDVKHHVYLLQTTTGEWLGRQRSAAKRELKTEASWNEI